MYKRILVAFDGSQTSQLALAHALELAKDQRAQVRVAYALESLHHLVSLAGGYPFDAAGLIDSMRQEGVSALNAAKEKAQAAGIDVETSLVEGSQATEPTAEILLQEAKRWNADLIVLGTHGRRGFERVMLGSVAEALVRNSPVPVLLVRGR
jgi:nucleotide-binding universal stress UspA family protein